MIARGIVVSIALALAAPSLAGTQIRTSAFEYDPVSGLLIKEIIEPGDSNLCLVTTYKYDPYGNKEKVTDSAEVNRDAEIRSSRPGSLCRLCYSQGDPHY